MAALCKSNILYYPCELVPGVLWFQVKVCIDRCLWQRIQFAFTCNKTKTKVIHIGCCDVGILKPCYTVCRWDRRNGVTVLSSGAYCRCRYVERVGPDLSVKCNCILIEEHELRQVSAHGICWWRCHVSWRWYRIPAANCCKIGFCFG
jgi:hypothetical protein